jgi:hypothetical protein
MRHLLLYAVLLPLSAQKPGDLLVATAANRDPGFAGTVLLLIHCDSQSATALVLNRPLAGSARSQISGWTGAELPVYAGGPVAAGLNGLVPRGDPSRPVAGPSGHAGDSVHSGAEAEAAGRPLKLVSNSTACVPGARRTGASRPSSSAMARERLR